MGWDDCDSVDSSCSKDGSSCKACDGHFSDSNSPQQQEFPGYRCCYGHNDCDSKKDWCSANTARCTECNGTLVAPTATPNASFAATPAGTEQVNNAVQQNQPDKKTETKHKDGSSWPFLMLAADATSAAGKCCYLGPKDCDNSRDWCSASAARCSRCGGNFSNATTQADATML